MRAWQIIAVVAALSLCPGCGGETSSASTPDSATGLPSASRLVAPSDADYADLETPEVSGECAESADCEESCVHSCGPVPTGPVTCPAVPTPTPDRVAAATCLCADTVCAWFAGSSR